MDFFEHLKTFMDEKEAKALLESLNRTEKKAIRVNSLKVDKIFDLIEKDALTPHKHVKNAFLYDKEKLDLGKSVLFHAGAYYIQEPAAMLAETLLEIRVGECVLDMCAAPGGKSFGAAIDLNDCGLLVCNDIHPIRARILSSNIEKYGFKNTIVLNDDSKNYKKHFPIFFDKIILDAPCSGSGMFRKNEQAKEEWSIEKVYQCARLQKELIEDTYEMLKPGGTLLYATCSFSIQENEEVIFDFLKKHSDMKIIPIKLNEQYSDTIHLSGGLRLYPHQYEGEGQCMFLLHKEEKMVDVKRPSLLKPARVGKEINEFLHSISFSYCKDHIYEFNHHYYLIDFAPFALNGVKFLRFGLELGEVFKNRFIPAHALAMAHPIRKELLIELNEEEAFQYLRGLTIYKEGNRGYAIASYRGLALGWVKQTNNILKNHYPKGLRISY